MLTDLSAKNKLKFVDGTLTEPLRTNSLYIAWRRCNNMVVSWIVHSVSVLIRQSILWMDKAIDIWRDLKSRYSQGDLLRISDLQHQASSIKQGDISVTDFFTKLRIIWDELENFRPNPICSCSPQCSCKALSSVLERKQQDQIRQFLHGLNDQYNQVKSHILMMDPLPPISKVFSYIVQQERQFIRNDGILSTLNLESKGLINVVSSNTSSCKFCAGNKVTSNRGTKSCTHCGKLGHTIDVCYRKHGFPPGHKFHNQNTHVNSSVTGDVHVTSDQQKQETHGLRFTSQQYQALLALIQQPSNDSSSSSTPCVNQIGTFSPCPTNNSSTVGNVLPFICSLNSIHNASWFLDSGATDHLSSSLAYFTSYSSIKPIVVRLPNGQEVFATHSGLVKFSETLFLSDVLYIPSFTFNLISISKLVSSLNCILTFSSNKCLI
uniref:Retrovirus-related Pol polyprotein from transposon TNT 1-94-like beta-barrel domain-containing protein n=1 Tax=Cajanus cajan TaxID=3821 RepID=A0A151TMZ7_CAJCA|nr:hypothetical protein KK1_022059 [Cajanus cajan]